MNRFTASEKWIIAALVLVVASLIVIVSVPFYLHAWEIIVSFWQGVVKTP